MQPPRQYTVEQPLRSCARRGAPEPKAILRIHPRRIEAGERTRLSLTAYGSDRRRRWPLPGATIRIAGREVITGPNGTASLQISVRRQGALPVRLVAPGLAPVSSRLSVGRP